MRDELAATGWPTHRSAPQAPQLSPRTTPRYARRTHARRDPWLGSRGHGIPPRGREPQAAWLRARSSWRRSPSSVRNDGTSRLFNFSPKLGIGRRPRHRLSARHLGTRGRWRTRLRRPRLEPSPHLLSGYPAIALPQAKAAREGLAFWTRKPFRRAIRSLTRIRTDIVDETCIENRPDRDLWPP